MVQSHWQDSFWTAESVDDWQPDNDPDFIDFEAANALFDMIVNGMDVNSESMRQTVVIIRESQIQRGTESRESRLMTGEEVKEVVSDLRYDDDRTDQEMRTYIQEVLSCITSGDEEDDMKSIEIFAGTIAAQQKVSKEQAKQSLI